jgi:hypothetical protein
MRWLFVPSSDSVRVLVGSLGVTTALPPADSSLPVTQWIAGAVTALTYSGIQFYPSLQDAVNSPGSCSIAGGTFHIGHQTKQFGVCTVVQAVRSNGPAMAAFGPIRLILLLAFGLAALYAIYMLIRSIFGGGAKRGDDSGDT